LRAIAKNNFRKGGGFEVPRKKTRTISHLSKKKSLKGRENRSGTRKGLELTTGELLELLLRKTGKLTEAEGDVGPGSAGLRMANHLKLVPLTEYREDVGGGQKTILRGQRKERPCGSCSPGGKTKPLGRQSKKRYPDEWGGGKKKMFT